MLKEFVAEAENEVMFCFVLFVEVIDDSLSLRDTHVSHSDNSYII